MIKFIKESLIKHTFKWAIVVLVSMFLIILADKWVFQPQEEEAKYLECSADVRSKIDALDEFEVRGLTFKIIEDRIDLCVKGY